jgi:hypothetical protein
MSDLPRQPSLGADTLTDDFRDSQTTCGQDSRKTVGTATQADQATKPASTWL